jgi:glycosyltransferase involved in cell wall biosynthesis
MKLSFCNFGSDRCGGIRVLFEVVNGLIEKGHDVSYLALMDQNWFPLKVPITVCKSPQDMPAAIPESDVVVATWCATAPIVDQVKGMKGVPAYYCQHHEPIFFFTPQEQQFVEATYRLNTNYIANSPWLQNILKEKYNKESTLIVPGVDLKTFTQKGRVNELKDATRENDVPLKVLAFASLTPFKGFYDTVLPAFNFVHRVLGKKVEFHVYGNLAPDQKYPVPLFCHGNLTDQQLAELYRSCDLFVSGSWAESSPLPHLEAMSCGTPVVCTEFGTEHYGESLVRVSPRAPRRLGEMIYKVLCNRELRGKMSLLGLESVKEFTWQNTVDKAECFFKGLVGEA